MAERRGPDEEARALGFAYFMIRLHHPAGEAPGALSGTVERLGSGEKQAFRSGAELVELLSSWPGAV